MCASIPRGRVSPRRGSGSFQHCYLILPFVLYLIWEKRHGLRNLVPEYSHWGVVAVGIASFGWFLGEISSVQLVQELALVGMLEGLFLAVFGWRVVYFLAFPLSYLFLAVPFGEFLVPMMQDWTAQFLIWSVDGLGMGVESDGLYINVVYDSKTYPFRVAKECSGIRYLIVMGALGLATAYLFFTSWSRRVAAVGGATEPARHLRSLRNRRGSGRPRLPAGRSKPSPTSV